MYGVPQRQDVGSNLVFDSGSRWSQPIYTCASSIKATIKTVSFNYNGTEGLLQSLAITDIQDKVYPDDNSMPLWGVENTGNSYLLSDMNLIWGLVSSEYENNQNVSTVRQESLYLPGFNALAEGDQIVQTENLPGSDFFSGAMDIAYSVLSSSSLGQTRQIDYSGQTNMAMWARWQNLTASAETASIIPSLIFTDNAASAVVGTKGVLGPGNAAPENTVPLLVTPTASRIGYHYPFAIPAFAACLGLILITLAAVTIVLFGRGSITKIGLHLKQVSPGRIYTTFLCPQEGSLSTKSKDWNKQMGQKMLDLSGQFPVQVDATVPPEKGATVTVYGPLGSDDPSAENGGFLGEAKHARERSEGDIRGNGFMPPQ
jgi:hypothetical protein